MSRKKNIISLVIGIVGVCIGMAALLLFNKYALMSFPIGARMPLMIITYYLPAIAPIILAIVNKEKLTDFGFRKEKIGLQILIGLGLGIGMSLVFTLVPHLLGLGEYVDNGMRYKYLWQFIFEFTYLTVGVGAVEEFIFRGFFYTRFKNIFGKEFLAIIFSSVLFGLFHISGGSIVQIILTGLLGALFCFFRLKIKHCSTLSLIIMHGVYDGFISLMASLLLK